ncbi:uncharacterized protein LOC133303110 [Gastrolobium bilobum]|uniref:uncharacterized protein LOC133303110 n=1 Tax=Gastrolobium bilobum TaxID=150636 RepID=UPI002AAF77C1|nr:uncharacterized protein LOC133303110 [Gastrolobium bilobum]
MIVNGAAGGTIGKKTTVQTLELIDNMARNENASTTVQPVQPRQGILQLGNNDASLDEQKILSQQIASLNAKLDKMQLSSAQVNSVNCEYCKRVYDTNECPTLVGADSFQVNGVCDTVINPREHCNPITTKSEDLEKDGVEASTGKNEQSQEEALKKKPSYAKFLKETISKNRKLTEDEHVTLTEECSAIIQKNFPPKLKDPGSFSIPCTIGKTTIEQVLCDLGASINVMPLTLMKKLGIDEVKPIRMNVQLADRSTKQAHDASVPIIFGRPFLATSRALIDVPKG